MEDNIRLEAWELLDEWFPKLFNKYVGENKDKKADGICIVMFEMNRLKIINFRQHLYLQRMLDMYSVSHRSKNSFGYMWPAGDYEQRLEFIKMNLNQLKNKMK